jgi:hypothetical protein
MTKGKNGWIAKKAGHVKCPGTHLLTRACLNPRKLMITIIIHKIKTPEMCQPASVVSIEIWDESTL